MLLTKVSFTSIPNFLTTANLQKEHKFMMSLFPEITEDNPRSSMDILYRSELSSVNPHYLIQSSSLPALENIKNLRLTDKIKLETKNIDTIYKTLIGHGTVSYKIRVNPVKTNQGKRTAVRGEENIQDWWVSKSNQLGLEIDLDRIQIIIEKDRKLQEGVKVASATIVGVTSIADAEKTIESVKTGIGKEKSYGFGLLLLGNE